MLQVRPKVIVKNDWDGYFQRLVEQWIDKATNPKHETVTITGQLFQKDAVDYYSNGTNLTLSFYPALRVGFGHLTEEEINDLISLI